MRLFAHILKRMRAIAHFLLTLSVFSSIPTGHAALLSISDIPITADAAVPPNLMFTLSVEWPTGTVAAYNDNANTTTGFTCPGRDSGVGVCYFADRTYLGYFDPLTCYTYNTSSNYFEPTALANSDHSCNGRWSGNFLNWSTMHALDEFRFALTGGDRIIDSATTTVIEKTFHNGQGGHNQFPIKRIRNTSYSANSLTVPAVSPSTVTPETWNTLFVRVTDSSTPLSIPGDSNSVGRVMQVADNSSFANSLGQTSGRYVRIVLAGENYLSLAEVQVISGSTNYATSAGTSASQSSTYNNRSATKAIDGNTSGNGESYVSHTNNDVNAWWQVDLGQARTIDKIVVWGRTDCCSDRLSNFYIFVSSTNMTGKTLSQLLADTSVNKTFVSSAPSPSLDTSNMTGTTRTPMYVRVKTCDSTYPPSAASRATCTAYGSTVKPTGLIQNNASRMRFGATAYLNDSDQARKGGVIRSRMKFVGANNIVPNGSPTTNTASEINSDGTQSQNPDGAAEGNSGVINYLNRFGKPSQSYKSTDTLSEMFYEATRYMRNLPATSAYTSGNITNTMKDGFPVITGWESLSDSTLENRPIQYSCQKTYFVGIADSNAWCDTYIPGNAATSMCAGHDPGSMSDEGGINVGTLLSEIGTAEGRAGLNTWSSSRGNTFNAAALSFWMNTRDILPDDQAKPWTLGKQTAQTFWVDVRETGSGEPPLSQGGTSAPYNQMWAAAKYGGFKDQRSNTSTVRNLSTNPLLSPEWKANGGPDPDNYFTGDRPDKLLDAFANIFQSINDTPSSGAAGAISTQNLTQAGSEFEVMFTPGKWIGDVVGKTISADQTTGALTTTEIWRAQSKLQTLAAGTGWNTARNIVSYNGTQGIPFHQNNTTGGNLTATQLTYLGASSTAQTNLINYIRGETVNEGSTFRRRTALLGDIVNSQAVYVGASPDESYSDTLNPGFSTFRSTISALNSGTGRTPVVYAGANDGMLHAFNAKTVDSSGTTITAGGNELFAYIPSFVLSGPSSPSTPSINGIASRATNGTFLHKYLVDQTPTIASVDFNRTGVAPSGGFSSSLSSLAADWRTILVGGLGKGGRGFYAIDITRPDSMSSESNVASKILWEFADADMGFSYGEPLIVKTDKYGWIVIVSSGYNNVYGSTAANRGKGYLYILNAKTGALLEKLTTGEGTETTPSGFGKITAFIPSYADWRATQIYGGDLNGNLWRFDLTQTAGSGGSYPSPIKLATFKDSASTPNPQAITAAPKIEIGLDQVSRWVFVGTGKLFDTGDLTTSGTQTFYALKDGTVTAPYADAGLPTGFSFPLDPRSALTAVTDLTTGVSALATDHPLGWYYDLPVTAGQPSERIFQAMTANEGVIAWIGATPSTDPCLPGAASSIYAVDYATGKSRVVNADGVIISRYTYSGLVTGLSAYKYGTGGQIKIGWAFTKGTGGIESAPINQNTFTGSPVRLNWREILQ